MLVWLTLPFYNFCGFRSVAVNTVYKLQFFLHLYLNYFHIPLPILTKHKLGLPFPPRNLPIQFDTNPSTIFLVIMVTDRQTDRQTHKPTPVKTYSLAFAGRIMDKHV